MEEIYPLTFEPVFRDYVWGGRNLERLYGRSLPPGITAESWEISGHSSTPTTVDAGHWQGRTLPEVLDALGERLVGANSSEMLARGRFPLLIKLLDANQDLSVQVHPDDDYAREHEHGELGKTEMWYVLHTQPRTELILGLARGVTRESFRQAVAEGKIASQLHRLRVHPGDCVCIPAGTVHALLAGAVVAEIQQNSDTTYRVYDWDRLGADGKPRELHIDKALDVTDFAMIEPRCARPLTLSDANGVRQDLLVNCRHFAVERIGLATGGAFQGSCDGRTFEVWGCVAGAASVVWRGDAVPLPAIRWALLPAALGEFQVRAEGTATLLRTYVGPL